MGCNGSKQQQDVATGNTVTRLFRRKSSVSESASTLSAATTSTTTVTDVVVVDEGSTKHVGAPPVSEKAEADRSPPVDMEETKQNPSSCTVASDNEDVVHVDQAGEATAPEAAGSEQGKTTEEAPEATVAENEVAQKEDATFSTKDDDGESIGMHSMDFKETMSVEEAVEAEGIHAPEINDAKSNEIENGSATD